MTVEDADRHDSHDRDEVGGVDVDAVTVALRGVSVRFPRRVRDSLTVEVLCLRRGERLIVIGPSGSGKSTLLHALTGVVPHTVNAVVSGEVVVCGKGANDFSVVELSRHVGVLGQDPSAGVCLPLVEQELALPLENRGVRPEEISGRIDEALASVGASVLRSRRSSELSGGEAQRVALAASLVARPDVLLLDEPTSMLDAAGVASVRRALAEASRHYDPTVVMVEHRLDEVAGGEGVAALPELALVLGEGGQVVAFGSTLEVLARHARTLHLSGCWLPLETELYAITGAGDGLGHPANRELLATMSRDGADSGPHPAGHGHGDAPGETVLAARRVSVARHPATAARRKRRKRIGGEAAALLREVDLDLRGGEVVALLGANGSGKSTLLLTLAGLLSPVSGSVEGARPGLVFQNPEHQFLAHTVTGEVGHGLREDRVAVTERLLRDHRLQDLADLNPFRLSGGEKRRLSIAAMLAHDRPALLLDEPTLGLDRRDTIATMAALRGAAAHGVGVLLASHDLRMVATLADRAIVLAEGRVVADGPVLDVLRDGAVLARAQLELPPLLDWLMRNLPSPGAVRGTLRALDRAIRPTATVTPPDQQVPIAIAQR